MVSHNCRTALKQHPESDHDQLNILLMRYFLQKDYLMLMTRHFENIKAGIAC